MTVAILLAIATLLPLASFLILVFVGKRMGNPIAGIVGTIFISGSFACSLVAMILWLTMGVNNPGTTPGAGAQPFLKTLNWVPVTNATSNNGFLQLGIYVDSLTVVMFSMITLVSALVFVFSLGYMGEDKRFPRFFTYLSLFCFSMLGLVIGGTILQLFIFWELVGLCSYLLIGFWYEKRSASNAAIKAFVVNRVGDFGFVIGLGILFFNLGNVTLPDVWKHLGKAGQIEQNQVLIVPTDGANGAAGTLQPAGSEQASKFNHMTAGMLTIMGIGLFFGAVGKSAQFPLHVWLPDAMEGPTPVSALIHAATMVAAGVYLVGRIFPILTPDAKLYIAITGAVTLTMAALIAIAQTDIKKVLAYSTLSQLGYMILAMGIGSWVGGLFHLITHAFFKALLFLGSGSVIHAAHHEQELTEYGGLLRKIPYTAITFGIAVLAIAGTGLTIGGKMIGFAGFYSKDLIIHHAGSFSHLATHTGKHGAYWLFFILPTIIAYVTAFYMTRCWMLTFWGKPRNQHLYDHAHEAPVMYVPLIVLAVLSVIGGAALGIQPMLENAIKETNNYFRAGANPIDPSFVGFNTAWAAETVYNQSHGPVAEAFDHGHHLLPYVSYAFVVGIGLGVLIYWNGFKVANVILRIPGVRMINIWLYRRMYFDELYMGTFVTILMGISWITGIFDKYIVDGLVNGAARLVKRSSDFAGLNDQYVVDGSVNGVATMAQNLGAAVRAPQTGRIRMYVLALMAAVALGLAAAIVIVLSRLGY
jgi:NADH-quinone oxidoreductase subunit L